MTHPLENESGEVQQPPRNSARPPPGVPPRRPQLPPNRTVEEIPGGLGGLLQQFLGNAGGAAGGLNPQQLLSVVQSSVGGMQLALTQLAKNIDYWRDRCSAHEEKIGDLEERLAEKDGLIKQLIEGVDEAKVP